MVSKKIQKIIIASVAVTVVGSIVGMLTCGWLFRWVYEIEPVNVWRPMDGPPGAIFFVASWIINLIFVSVYSLFYKGIPGKNVIAKGLVYGLCVFAVGQLTGMVMTYMFMTVAWQVVVYLTIGGLIFTPIYGIIAAAICGKQE